jgi:plasmid stabilization system protein ParE
MGQVTIHPDAQRELNETIAYYEEVREGLGREFNDEVTRFIQRIQENPRRYSIRRQEVRRANLARFPYNVNYLIENGGVLILAFAHNRRKPLYWLPRLKK